MAYTCLADIWADYDVRERKRFKDHDITKAINMLPEDGPEVDKCHHEALAFAFVGNNHENVWGTYYGYRGVFEKKDTGEKLYSPDISHVTPEIISYWEKRASEVVNPLLKMRYTGLVMDFKKRVTGEKPAYKTIKIAHVNAIIDVIEGGYADDYLALEYADRALNLAVGFKKEKLVQRAVKAYFNAVYRNGDDYSWGHIMRTLTKYPSAFAQYRDDIVNKNTELLNIIEQKALEEGEKTDRFVHEMCDLVDIFCEYYHNIGNNGKIEELLDRLLEAVKKPMTLKGGMWGQGMLEHMQTRYRKYGLDNKANRLFVEISEQGRKALKEMQKTQHTYTLKREKIDAMVKVLMRGSHRERMVRYIVEYIPCMKNEIKRYKEYVKKHSLEDIVTTVLFDGEGTTTNRLGAGKKPEERKLHHFMYYNLLFLSPFMHIHIEELKKSKDLTTENLMQMFDGCPLMTDKNRELLERGFEAYVNDDYIVCCHILIPQIEAMVRRLVMLNGGEVIHQGEDPSVGNLYSSLDSLLDSAIAKELMREDIINYFKMLLVSPAGWNLRNLFCHGLLTAGNFNDTMADRVVHAVVILSQFKYKTKV